MCDIPMDLQRRFERRGAARFSGPAKEHRLEEQQQHQRAARTGSAAPPLSVRGRSIVTWLGAKPSSSAALKAAATKGSRIISEICRRLTVVRNSDAVVRGVVLTLLALVMDLSPSWLGLEPGRKLQLPLGLPVW